MGGGGAIVDREKLRIMKRRREATVELSLCELNEPRCFVISGVLSFFGKRAG